MLRSEKMPSVAYFDNAATTFPKPESVYSFMDDYYRTNGVNVGRGQHKLAYKATGMVDETRKLLLELFHCPNRKVIFTPSSTEALNILIQGQEYFDDCNIYISPFEHNAVTRVLHHLEYQYHINVHQLSVDRTTMSYDIEKIKVQFLNNKPNYLIISHASNICGLIAPIEKLCNMAKRYDATTIIDMSQTAGLVDTNLNNDDIDFAVFAGHKTLYGPFGISGFITKESKLPKPLIFGGTGVESANQDLPEQLPARFEVGSVNVAALAGLHASLQWIKQIGISTVFEKEQKNHQRLLNLLSEYSNIHLVGTENASRSIGVISCVFDGYGADSIGQVLSEHNVAVRTGLHCSPFAHQFLGTFPSGTVRFSASYFTTEEEFEVLHSALDFIEENS
jgi:cysteine desulfurase family protein